MLAQKVEVYKLMEEICKQGMAILFISSEAPEIIGLSDRIVVIHEGRITGECNYDEIDQEES